MAETSDTQGRGFAPANPLVTAACAAVIGCIVVGVLYVGRDLLIPLALALLLSFVLSPLVGRAKKLGAPRTPAVIVVALSAFLLLFGLSAIIAGQVGQLAADLPQYQSTMRQKAQSVREITGGSRTLERAGELLQSLGQELNAPAAGGRTLGPDGRPIEAERKPDQPLPVEIHSPPPTPLQNLQAILEPLVHPLATTGIVLIFVIFILLQREDLRNRLMSLAGAHDIQRTTAALDDAAKRLSRLLLTQLAINIAFGVGIGCGLALIGVPSAALWGILAAVLRFVPYIGAIISAIFPLALAAAVDPGWSMLIWTAVLFAVVEPIVGHVVEPLAYGRSTGLSPVAVVVAATFWTALWGPIGLVLATPLTVCLVVLGRHVQALRFLDVMFGDRPSLSPPELFYQRMLVGDPAEAAEKAEEFLRERSLSAYYEEVALPGLMLASRDALSGALDERRIATVRAAADELVEDLDEWDDADPQPPVDPTQDMESVDAVERADADASAAALPDASPARPLRVRCVGARGAIDQAAAGVVRQVLEKHGMAAALEADDFLSTTSVVELDGPERTVIFLASLAPSEAHLRLAVRRIRRRAPGATVVLGCWSIEGEAGETAMRRAGADAVGRSLPEVVALCLAAGEPQPETGLAEGPVLAAVT
ncbi:putative PurR-regulated permease PerM [Methylopila capsulata]|uniref:ABC transporter permease n=1 Tax=Methylopila capsulata TaxID=61654 RepID=A0A9W6ITK8_9HYPH|nr:AI-2E family transporter [Methylopila capsulata]MBM7850680.1 putative PurR-regulated permease PerM [Methylopila capsulata]GLK55973.1 ABC transporter permease [Methylopila capsulata]